MAAQQSGVTACHVSYCDYDEPIEADFMGRTVMAVADTYVRARIDSETKERAAAALETMGLSVSDAIRMLMLRVADERCLPFEVRVPDFTTQQMPDSTRSYPEIWFACPVTTTPPAGSAQY